MSFRNGHCYARETVNSSLLSNTHGRQRRLERNIEKIDLQRARRYGMKEVQSNGRIRYTYGGIVFIYCAETNREITSFPSRDAAPESSGTKNAKTILLEKYKWGHAQAETQDLIAHQLHSMSNAITLTPFVTTFGTATPTAKSTDSLKSHSVLVVDMSGSMRRDDVNGARCRSDGVWMSLARDYVKIPLEKGTRSEYDLISIIVMKEDAKTVINFEPTTWILYNKLIDMREWSHLRPSGPGNYLPAIDEAERLLMTNSNAGCALSLLFFSDGRPSDQGDFSGRVGTLASKFGRRLSISCVGMAEESEDFSTLKEMVTEAQSYGAHATFGKPTLDSDSLSNIITSLASSLTSSKTEMTNLRTGKSRLVRMDFQREKLNTPNHIGDWTAYENSSPRRFVRRIWDWSFQRGSCWVRIIDRRCSECYTEALESMHPYMCSVCKACYICERCTHSVGLVSHAKECNMFLNEVRLGRMIPKEVPSFSIIMKDKFFGEGAERIVRKVRFIDRDGSCFGDTMVAKESRFVENDGNNYQKQMNYHEEFMRTQKMASEYAKEYNETLDRLLDHFHVLDTNFCNNLPRITFLEPIVIEVIENGVERNILVEKFLKGEYTKFNSNMGYVNKEVDVLMNRTNNMDLGYELDALGAIEEGSEEEDSDEEIEHDGIFDTKKSTPDHMAYSSANIKDAYFPQAFSHFTYEKSKKKFMVVDLQGVFTKKVDGTKCYELTDPVIHMHRKKCMKKFSSWNFGRTNRGEKGMNAFFGTHRCTGACKLLGLKDVKMQS